MYSWPEILEGIKNPKKTAIKKGWDLFGPVHSIFTRNLLGRSDPLIPKQDWDNLLLLDACRYDIFEKNNILKGELKPTYSVASNTSEFVEKTFEGNKFPDIICVTSTPKYQNVANSFHDIIRVWEDDWNEDYGTVLPKTMNKRVREAAKDYPNKRLWAHYIPPHQPFIGETGKKMPQYIQFAGDTIQQNTEAPEVWSALRRGQYDRQRVWKAYEENLQLTLPHIQDIMRELQGKTVVTSDHGNAFGRLSDGFVVGHPRGRHIKNLIKVPWLEYQNGSRKKIIREDIKSSPKKIKDAKVQQRLVDLGYT